MKGHSAALVEVFAKKTQLPLVKSEERVNFGLMYKPPVDQSTEVNEDPKDNGKYQSFWKCCAFETIIILESAFLKLYLRYT